MLAALLLGSCGGNKEKQQEINAPSVETDSVVAVDSMVDESEVEADTATLEEEKVDDTAELEASARKFVNDMYANVFRGAYDVNTKYFTSDFVNLYNKTRALESRLKAESDSDGGMDEEFFDDEFWSSYNDDPLSSGAKASISKITLGKNGKGIDTAKVIVNVKPRGNESPIKIDLVMTDSGWKISDYRGYKAPMQRYLKYN